MTIVGQNARKPQMSRDTVLKVSVKLLVDIIYTTLA